MSPIIFVEPRAETLFDGTDDTTTVRTFGVYGAVTGRSFVLDEHPAWRHVTTAVRANPEYRITG